MTQGWFDALSEQKFFDQYQANETANTRYKAGATPELSARVGQIYSQSPWMTPGQVLSLAKGNASPQAVELASQAQAKRVPALLDPNKPDDKGFFERNIFDKIKETTRWSFAALDTVKDLSQNVASQVFNPNDPAGFDGWFQSTSLGTMLSDSEQAGEGFFLGGKAAEKQAERARRVRGTINGSAWTIGRGAASVVFTPGSKAYGIASGLLDAVVAVGSDPTFLGGKAYAGAKGFGSLAELKSAQAAIQGVRSAEELSAVQKLLKATARADAGLTDAESLVVDSSKFLKFWQTDTRARRLVSNLGDPANNDAFSIFRDTFNGKIDIPTAKRLAAAKNENEVLSVIADVTNRLDDANPNLLPTDIRQLPGAKFGAFQKQRSGLYNSFRHNKLFTTMPEQVVIAGTDLDNAKAVLNYGRFLDTIGTGKAGVAFSQTTEGRTLLNKIMDAYESGAAASIKQVDEVFDETVKVLLKQEGATEEQIKNLFKNVKQAGEETRAYFVNAAGRPEDGGFVAALLDSGQADLTDFADLDPAYLRSMKLNGPGSVLELMDRTRILPDVREVRRISGNRMMKRALTRRGGDQRAAVAYSEYLQNKVWKPLTLATGGYIMRNMVDAQVRIATIGKEGFFNHPIRYMQWVMARKAPETITGRNFDEIMKAAVDDISRDETLDPFVEVMTDGLKRNLEDPLAIHAHAVKNGAYELVTKQGNRDRWFLGLGEEYAQIAKDGVMNAWAKGVPINEMIDYLRGTPKGKEYLRQFERYLKTGVTIVDNNGNQRVLKVKEVNDNVLKAWIEKLAGSRVELKTGGDPDLKLAIGHRRVPFGPTQSIDSNSIALTDIVDGPRELGRGTVFRAGVDADGNDIFYLVTDAKSITGTKSSVIPEFDEADQLSLTIRRVSNNDIIDTPEGRAEFAEFVKSRNTVIEGDKTLRQLPGTVKIAQRGIGVREPNAAEKALDRFTDWFFVGVYGKASQTFEKSPVFRQFYYEQISKNVDLLSKDEAVKLLKYIDDSATRNGISVENYVGGKKTLARINKLAETASGEGTIKELDDFAQLVALNSTKEALYNASSRNNLEDIMRILIPFGVAYREVTGTYLRLLAEDPTRIRKAQLIYSGAENFDPDNDGQGFFYKDPTTGENVFNFPFSGELTKLLTGVEAPLQGGVKRLSLGLQVIPSLGPVGQIAASELIPDSPKFDDVVGILLPYGRGSFNAMPSWAGKIKSALRDDPSKLESIYANTYVDTLRALSVSGDYDLDDEQSKANLMADAKSKAKVLTALRGFAQFVGPTAPSLEYVVKTKSGDVYASAMVQEFYRLQNQNYDTAVSEFIKLFGDDAVLYLSSKSKSVAGGLEASEQFGDWERDNENLLEQFPSVAGFLAPGGDDFSFEVWDRQLRKGRRERLSDVDIIKQAQYRMGSAIYRSYRTQVGAYPTSEQRAWLGNIRKEINKRYAGFPVTPVFTVGEFESKMSELRTMIQLPQLENNGVAKSIATYLDYRDKAVQQYVSAGGAEGGFDTAKKAEPLRDYLVSIGQALIQQNPDFARIWDRELSSEVDK
jgi:hypothetical protein